MNDKINELFCKIDAQDRLINYQALKISSLKKELEELQQKIDKAIELIKRSAGYKGICTQPETDTFSTLLAILGGTNE